MGCTASVSMDSLKTDLRSAHALKHTMAKKPEDASDLSGLLSKNYNRLKLKENARHGLTHAMRLSAWPLLALTSEISKPFPHLYELLLQHGRSLEYDRAIVLDVARAMPSIPYFGTAQSPGIGQAQLYRILTAYAHLDRGVGYCHGMHFVGALLLLVGLAETTAFYVFVSVMLRFGLAGLYRPGLPLVHTCTQVLTSLLAHSHPELFRHMHVQLGVSPAQFAPQWLMSAFISSRLPISTCVALFDVLLCDEDPKPVPQLIHTQHTVLSSLFPHLVVPLPRPKLPAKLASKSSPHRRAKAEAAPAATTAGAADGKTAKGLALGKSKSALKGTREAEQVHPPDAIAEAVSELPHVLLCACVGVLARLESQLLAAGSVHEALAVIGAAPAATALIAPRTLGQAPTSTHTHAHAHPHAHPRLHPSDAPAPPVLSATAHYVRALEMLDGLDDFASSAQSVTGELARVSALPALPPSVWPADFIGSFTGVGPTATPAPAPAPGPAPAPAPAHAAHPAGPGPSRGVHSPSALDNSSVASMRSVEELALPDDALARLLSPSQGQGLYFSSAALAARWTMCAGAKAGFSLTRPSPALPTCDYILQSGRLPGLPLATPKTLDDGLMMSPTSAGAVSPTMGMFSPVTSGSGSATEFVCDGKLVQAWMLPRQFRNMMNSPDHAIPTWQFDSALRSSTRLSIATSFV